jgi:hypothetical protein
MVISYSNKAPGTKESFMLDLSSFFFLLIIFQLKHFTGNFSVRSLYLSKSSFLRKDFTGKEAIKTLAIHSLIHASITLGLAMILRPSCWYISVIDFTTHFTLDYLKVNKKLLGRWDTDHPLFWWGLDLIKLCHNLLYYYFIYALLVPSA